MTGAWYEGLSAQRRFESGSVSFHGLICFLSLLFSFAIIDKSRDEQMYNTDVIQ